MKKNILIETEEKIFKLNLQEVIYFKSDGCYTEIHSISGSKNVVSKLLKSFEDKLDKNFYRSHKSYIVNLSFFKELKKCPKGKLRCIVLENNHIIPLASRRVISFKETLKALCDVTFN